MKDKSVVIGLTGQTGAGKTTVSKLLAAHGLRVIDADVVARQVVQKGTRCLMDLTLEFGTGILLADGSLNRRKLGSLAFNDENKRRSLNRITFPYIHEEISEQIRRCKEAGDLMIVLDAPTLLESGGQRHCDMVVSVIAPQEVRLQRILARDPISLAEAEARMNSQHDDEYYTSRSDFVICNDGDLPHLRFQVVEMIEFCRPVRS